MEKGCYRSANRKSLNGAGCVPPGVIPAKGLPGVAGGEARAEIQDWCPTCETRELGLGYADNHDLVSSDCGIEA